MIDGWITDEIDNLCNVEYGSRVVKKNDGGTIYPVYGGGDATFFMDIYNREDRLTIARFAMSEKCTRFVKGKFFLNDSGLTLSPKDSSKIEQKFLDYQCLAMNDAFYSLAKGAAQKNLDVPAFRKLKLNIPKDVKTQRAIVAKLEAIFAEIDKATAASEANAKNAEALFQSYLDKLFEEDEISNDKVSIKNVCKIGDGNHSSKYPKKDEMVESGIPFIRSTNIVNGALSDKDLVFLTEDKHKELKKGHLKTGDILITNRGEIGKVAMVDERFDNSNLNSQIAWLRCNPLLKNQYLFFFLMSAKMRFFYNDTKTGAALQQLPIGKIEKINIPLPSVETQIKRCAEFLSVQQKCIVAMTSYKNKALQLSQIKQSILTKALAGELVKE